MLPFYHIFENFRKRSMVVKFGERSDIDSQFVFFQILLVIIDQFLLMDNCLSSQSKRFLPLDNGWLTLVIVGGVFPTVSDGVVLLNLISSGFCLVVHEQILTSLLWKQPPWKPPWNRQQNLVFEARDYTHHEVIYMWCSADDVIDRFIKYLRFQLFLVLEKSLQLIFCPKSWSNMGIITLQYLPRNGEVTSFHVDEEAPIYVEFVIIKRKSWENYLHKWRVSIVSSKETFDKRENIQSQSGRSMKSTLLSRTRIRTNWYRVNNPKHVTDAMVFSGTIWKAKEAMPIWHTHCIKVRQIEKKEDNIIQWLLACKAYLERKQRSISFFLIFCLQCMAHISAYVIICNSMFCIRLCNTLCTLIF